MGGRPTVRIFERNARHKGTSLGGKYIWDGIMYRDDRLTAPRHDLRGSGPQWEGSAWIVRWERAPWRWGKDGWRWTVSQERASCSGGDGRSGIFFFFFLCF